MAGLTSSFYWRKMLESCANIFVATAAPPTPILTFFATTTAKKLRSYDPRVVNLYPDLVLFCVLGPLIGDCLTSMRNQSINDIASKDLKQRSFAAY